MKRILLSFLLALSVSCMPVMAQSVWDVLGQALNQAVQQTNQQLRNQIQQQYGTSQQRKAQNSTTSTSSYNKMNGIYEVTCYICGGSGKCTSCGGSCYISFTSSVSGNTNYIQCPNCALTGTCSTCHGSGKTLIDDGTLDGRTSDYDNSNSSGSSYGSSSSWCSKCHGKKVCPTCNGKGIYFSRMYGADQWITCPACSGSKRCPLCN